MKDKFDLNIEKKARKKPKVELRIKDEVASRNHSDAESDKMELNKKYTRSKVGPLYGNGASPRRLQTLLFKTSQILSV